MFEYVDVWDELFQLGLNKTIINYISYYAVPTDGLAFMAWILTDW